MRSACSSPTACAGDGEGYQALGKWGDLHKAGRHLAARAAAVEGSTSGASRHYKAHMQRLWDVRLGARLALQAPAGGCPLPWHVTRSLEWQARGAV